MSSSDQRPSGATLARQISSSILLAALLGLLYATTRAARVVLRDSRLSIEDVQTHYLAEAELLCDRIGLLFRGRLLREGTPTALRAEAGTATLEEAFLTSSRYEYLFWEMAWRLEAWPV